MFNGWLTTSSVGFERLQSDYYDGPDPMAQEAFVELKKRAKSAIKQLLTRSMPCRPQEGKWTKVFPCVLWFQLISTMGVLKMLIPRSYSAMCYQIQRDPDKFSKNHSAYNSEVSYSEVQGTMIKTFEHGVNKAGNDDNVAIFAIALEPIA